MAVFYRVVSPAERDDILESLENAVVRIVE